MQKRTVKGWRFYVLFSKYAKPPGKRMQNETAVLETKKEKILFIIVTGIAGACIATACFYVVGAVLALLFAGLEGAKALVTAWMLWIEFFLLALLVFAAAAFLSLRRKTNEDILPEKEPDIEYNLDGEEDWKHFLEKYAAEETEEFREGFQEELRQEETKWEELLSEIEAES